jgi:hypothetical protein
MIQLVGISKTRSPLSKMLVKQLNNLLVKFEQTHVEISSCFGSSSCLVMVRLW